MMDFSWAGELGVLVAALVSSVFGWVSARNAERHTRPNGSGERIIDVVESNQRVLTQLLSKTIELDSRVDRIENGLRDK